MQPPAGALSWALPPYEPASHERALDAPAMATTTTARRWQPDAAQETALPA
jgi:hypothetical protein